MKQPKINNLLLDTEGTKKIRLMAKKTNKVKITVNIDQESLSALKFIADKSGGSYQKILNQILREGLENYSDSQNRLEKLEREVAKIKKKLSA